MEKLFITIDPEGISLPVIETGLKLGRSLNAEVVLVSIVPTKVNVAIASSGVPYGAEQLDAELAMINEYLTKVKNENADMHISIHSTIGEVRQTLLEFIKSSNPTLVVIGTHGRTGFEQIFMGGTAEYLVRHSTVPLVVVPFNKIEH